MILQTFSYLSEKYKGFDKIYCGARCAHKSTENITLFLNSYLEYIEITNETLHKAVFFSLGPTVWVLVHPKIKRKESFEALKTATKSWKQTKWWFTELTISLLTELNTVWFYAHFICFFICKLRSSTQCFKNNSNNKKQENLLL